SRFQQFRDSLFQEYDSFKDKINAEYANFLKESWQEFQNNKPVDEPVFEPVLSVPAPMPVEPVKHDANVVVHHADSPTEPTPDAKTVQSDVNRSPADPINSQNKNKTSHVPDISSNDNITADPSKSLLPVHFYGLKTSVAVDMLHIPYLLQQTEQAVADMWSQLSKNIVPVEPIEALCERNHWCQWAVVQYADSVAHAVYPKHHNERTVLQMWLLSQQGISARLAYDNNNRFYILVAVDGGLYGKPYFTLDDQQYYLLEQTQSESLLICNHEFGQNKPLSLMISHDMTLGDGKSIKVRQLKSDAYPQMTADVSVDQDFLNFYAHYPSGFLSDNKLSRWEILAKAPLCPTTQSSLYGAIEQSLEGHSDEERIEMLLNFVQTAFEYGNDNELWGGDRAFFADETCYYPYSDCEDRTILFVNLVRHFTNVQVAILMIPRHLFAAVALPGNPKGMYITIGDQQFTIADPTCKGAVVGQPMDGVDYSHIEALVVR
ncbi:MAG: hypothetical protein KBT04_04430, partial [Bacteroidales bacterium]|nr:hypothetical protein [Candidatus Colimorpha onthohippi]